MWAFAKLSLSGLICVSTGDHRLRKPSPSSPPSITLKRNRCLVCSEKTPHPLAMIDFSPLPWGEGARVTSRVRGLFPQGLANSQLGFTGSWPFPPAVEKPPQSLDFRQRFRLIWQFPRRLKSIRKRHFSRLDGGFCRGTPPALSPPVSGDPKQRGNKVKILMVLTSHDQLGNTGRKTGFWLEEFAAPRGK